MLDSLMEKCTKGSGWAQSQQMTPNVMNLEMRAGYRQWFSESIQFTRAWNDSILFFIFLILLILILIQFNFGFTRLDTFV